jgi:hypothetical protein
MPFQSNLIFESKAAAYISDAPFKPYLQTLAQAGKAYQEQTP